MDVHDMMQIYLKRCNYKQHELLPVYQAMHLEKLYITKQDGKLYKKEEKFVNLTIL